MTSAVLSSVSDTMVVESPSIVDDEYHNFISVVVPTLVGDHDGKGQL